MRRYRWVIERPRCGESVLGPMETGQEVKSSVSYHGEEQIEVAYLVCRE